MPFQFPDPNVQSEIVHPITGEHWHYVNGAWEVEDSDVHDPDEHHSDSHHADAFAPKSLVEEVDENEEQLQAVTTTLLNLLNRLDGIDNEVASVNSYAVGVNSRVDEIESLDLTNALSALATAKQDIIDLKSKVDALELTSFLILE
jgi:peptidoglycan hydrolase CwlO-like protein